MKTEKTILYLGQKNFPVGMAATQRQLQISKALKNDSSRIIAINRKGPHSLEKIKSEHIKVKGSFEGINYIYASCTPRYFNNFLLRNFLKIWGAVVEFFVLLFYSLTRRTVFIAYTSSLSLLKYYWILSRALHIKVVYDYVEYFSSLDDRTMKEASLKKSFDTEFYKYADSFIVISSFLEQHLKSLTSKPSIIVPPIIDFDKFSRINLQPVESNYFLYCGSVQYIDVAEFIIDAYHRSGCAEKGTQLLLIVNGSQKKIKNLQKSVEADNTIKILSSLSYEVLIGYYKHAKALLIPLQDNLQDKARFPFKISEYTAASRPIITSDSGAVIDYFQDGVNALLAKTGDVNDFSEKLKFIVNNPEQSEQIAANGHTLGQQFFNYRSYATSLDQFITQEHSKTIS